MKKNKIMAMGLAALMALSAGSACAERRDYLNQTPIPSRVVTTVKVSEGLKKGNVGRKNALYVRHYLWSDIAGYYGSSHHTNFFQAIPVDETVRYGGDWMAPDSANYIRSGSIQSKNTYSVGARANTKYADDGFATIRISGYMAPDAK